MPQDEPIRPTAAPEEFDPTQTVFFQRRKRRVSLLPLIVISSLILGSGALIAWAVSQSSKKPTEETERPSLNPYAGQKVLSTAEARALANPVIGPAAKSSQTVDSISPPTTATPAVGSTPPLEAAPFDETKPVRAARAVDGSGPPMADSMAALNLNVQDAENARVKDEVLRRIDLMPGVSAANKDKLYASVDHARGMGRVLTIPFEKGESAVRTTDIERIKIQMQTPQIKQLIDDPTVVFVVLGYADQKGNEKINSEVSLTRARSVLDALRDKCGFQNVMHAVAMGGSTLFSAQEAEKNRVVEIWAVLP
jgi:outer membrane protein OmpA-like peptidoglycan-associated protein